MAQKLQKSIVPWLISIYGIQAKTSIKTDQAIVPKMIVGLVKRDNLCGLASTFNSLTNQHADTFERIVNNAIYAAGAFFYC